MKNVRNFILAIIFLTSLKVSAQTPDQIDSDAAATSMMQNVQKMQEDMARLTALIPLTNEQLKEWLPESLGELKRISFSVGEQGHMGIGNVKATFNTTEEPEFVTSDTGGDEFNTNNKTFTIEVVDGAGPGAEIFSTTIMMANMNMLSDDRNKEVKSVNINGIEGQQTYHKQANKTSLYFIYQDRFGISVTGNHLNPEETSKYFEKFNLEDLAPND